VLCDAPLEIRRADQQHPLGAGERVAERAWLVEVRAANLDAARCEVAQRLWRARHEDHVARCALREHMLCDEPAELPRSARDRDATAHSLPARNRHLLGALDGNRFDLDEECSTRELRYADGGRRRAVRAEVLLASRAQNLQILTGQHEHAELHDGVDADAVRCEASTNVLERDVDLFCEAVRNRAVRTNAYLAREKKDLVTRCNQGGVRVRPNGRMNLAGV
jgi:hypothetical protein